MDENYPPPLKAGDHLKRVNKSPVLGILIEVITNEICALI
jgi:hypothetical protein